MLVGDKEVFNFELFVSWSVIKGLFREELESLGERSVVLTKFDLIDLNWLDRGSKSAETKNFWEKRKRRSVAMEEERNMKRTLPRIKFKEETSSLEDQIA